MKKVALLVAETAILLVLLEIAIRNVVPTGVDVPHLRVFPEGYYTWYPGSRFTYHNLPNVVPPSAAVSINEHGLRGPSLPREKPPGETRVLVIGDSFTAAVQLPEERIFTTLLERDLNGGAAGRYRVLNAGFNGAGTAHELLYFLQQGLALAPDVVVLQYASNDLGDNLAHGGFHVTSAGLELSETFRHPSFWRRPLLAMRDAVGNRSLVFYLIYKALRDIIGSTTGGDAHAAGPAPASADPAVMLVQHLTARLIASAKAIGARVIVLTIPSPLYLAGGDASYDAVVAAFDALAVGGNRLIVTDPLLLESERRAEPVYLAFDGHLGDRGHEIVAAALAGAIREGTPAPQSRAAVVHGRKARSRADLALSSRWPDTRLPSSASTPRTRSRAADNRILDHS